MRFQFWQNLNCPKHVSCWSSWGRAFHTLGPAAEKLLSLKLLCVRNIMWNITHHHVAYMSTWCLVISLFYDFCSSWCVAFNTMDKLQFLSFIFAVLLSTTVHFIALRQGRAIMHQHTKIILKSVEMFFGYHDLSIFVIWQLATMLNF